ncbi:endonuclease/exonuclease/phosphatase family protein [Georgenia faecalis]|uniref:Endonuclease/exonuclease/phosphatase family protein n=1 Tax=Georgenia faecalis TaxID=2483799 RepID=A0ABV9DAF4_9MICO|nr:endonuclease/exonuclease/phosphatase family protein [Georgenia faecalis]
MRLATFNILHGRSLVDREVDLDRYARAVADLDADVLALQEVDRDQPRSHGADLTAIAADAMGAPHHRFAATLTGLPGVWTGATGDHQPNAASYGVALLSRYPVTSWSVLKLPALRGRVPVVFPGRRRLNMVLDEPRVALVAVVEAPGGPMTVVSTHLTFIPGWGPVQLRRLVYRLADLPRPAVLMGDLNLVGSRPAQVTGWHTLAEGLTFPVADPNRQLDHILADGPLRPTSDSLSIDTGVSDHRALVVEVEQY